MRAVAAIGVLAGMIVAGCSALPTAGPTASDVKHQEIQGQETRFDLVDIDDNVVTALLARVNVPTLVMHLRDDLLNPFEAGRQMAAGIPGARFVTLHGKNHFFLPGEPAAIRFWEELQLFLSK